MCGVRSALVSAVMTVGLICDRHGDILVECGNIQEEMETEVGTDRTVRPDLQSCVLGSGDPITHYFKYELIELGIVQRPWGRCVVDIRALESEAPIVGAQDRHARICELVG